MARDQVATPLLDDASGNFSLTVEMLQDNNAPSGLLVNLAIVSLKLCYKWRGHEGLCLSSGGFALYPSIGNPNFWNEYNSFIKVTFFGIADLKCQRVGGGKAATHPFISGLSNALFLSRSMTPNSTFHLPASNSSWKAQIILYSQTE